MRRGGFTLVEILVASAVLAVLALGVFRVFGSANRANVQALWYTKAQSEARELLSLIRNDLAKASCPSDVQEMSVVRTPCTATITQGDITLPGADGAVILQFDINKPSISTPTHSGPPGGESTTCALRAFGTTLNYTRQGDAAPAMNKDVCEDVAKITIEVRRNASGAGGAGPPPPSAPVDAYDTDGSVVEITVELRHPQPELFPQSSVIEKTTARIPVPVG